MCKHFGPRSSPTSVGSRLCPNYLWECFVVSAKVVATYSMGGSSKQSGTVSGATLCRVWLGSKLFVFFYRSSYSNPVDQAQSRLLSVWSYSRVFVLCFNFDLLFKRIGASSVPTFVGSGPTQNYLLRGGSWSSFWSLLKYFERNPNVVVARFIFSYIARFGERDGPVERVSLSFGLISSITGVSRFCIKVKRVGRFSRFACLVC